MYRFGRPADRIELVPTVPLNLQVGALRLDDGAVLTVAPRSVGVVTGERDALQRH